MNAWASSGLAARGGDGDRVAGDRVELVGNVDATDRVRGIAGDVRGIDDAGVGLAQRDLAQHRAHVFLIRHHVGQHGFAVGGGELRELGCPGQEIKRVLTDGYLLGGQHQLEARVGQVFERGDAGRIVARMDHHQAVAREGVLRAADDVAGFDHHVHLGVVGRGEDVGGCALDNLLRQLIGAGEVEAGGRSVGGVELLADLGERIGQRGGGEYQQLTTRAGLTDAGRGRGAAVRRAGDAAAELSAEASAEAAEAAAEASAEALASGTAAADMLGSATEAAADATASVEAAAVLAAGEAAAPPPDGAVPPHAASSARTITSTNDLTRRFIDPPNEGRND